MRGNLGQVYKLYDTVQDSEEKARELLNDRNFLRAADIDDHKRELLLGEDMEGSTKKLVQEEVLDKVIEGTEPTKVWRDILPTVTVDTGYQLRVPYISSSERYAPKVPEGGQIPERSEEFSRTNIDLEKWGEQPIITEEMLRMSLFDVVELELRKAGMSIENRINREALSTIITNCTDPSQISPGGTHIAVTDISTARRNVLKKDHMPDTLVLHPTAEGYLLQDSNLLYVAYAGQGRTLETGQVPKLLGLTPHTCTATDASSPTWDDTSAGTDVTAMVLDSQAPAAMIAMAQANPRVTQWKDPLYDLHRVVVRQEFGVSTIMTDAVNQIYHK